MAEPGGAAAFRRKRSREATELVESAVKFQRLVTEHTGVTYQMADAVLSGETPPHALECAWKPKVEWVHPAVPFEPKYVLGALSAYDTEYDGKLYANAVDVAAMLETRLGRMAARPNPGELSELVDAHSVQDEETEAALELQEDLLVNCRDDTFDWDVFSCSICYEAKPHVSFFSCKGGHLFCMACLTKLAPTAVDPEGSQEMQCAVCKVAMTHCHEAAAPGWKAKRSDPNGWELTARARVVETALANRTLECVACGWKGLNCNRHTHIAECPGARRRTRRVDVGEHTLRLRGPAGFERVHCLEYESDQQRRTARVFPMGDFANCEPNKFRDSTPWAWNYAYGAVAIQWGPGWGGAADGSSGPDPEGSIDVYRLYCKKDTASSVVRGTNVFRNKWRHVETWFPSADRLSPDLRTLAHSHFLWDATEGAFDARDDAPVRLLFDPGHRFPGTEITLHAGTGAALQRRYGAGHTRRGRTDTFDPAHERVDPTSSEVYFGPRERRVYVHSKYEAPHPKAGLRCYYWPPINAAHAEDAAYGNPWPHRVAVSLYDGIVQMYDAAGLRFATFKCSAGAETVERRLDANPGLGIAAIERRRSEPDVAAWVAPPGTGGKTLRVWPLLNADGTEFYEDVVIRFGGQSVYRANPERRREAEARVEALLMEWVPPLPDVPAEEAYRQELRNKWMLEGPLAPYEWAQIEVTIRPVYSCPESVMDAQNVMHGTHKLQAWKWDLDETRARMMRSPGDWSYARAAQALVGLVDLRENRSGRRRPKASELYGQYRLPFKSETIAIDRKSFEDAAQRSACPGRWEVNSIARRLVLWAPIAERRCVAAELEKHHQDLNGDAISPWRVLLHARPCIGESGWQFWRDAEAP